MSEIQFSSSVLLAERLGWIGLALALATIPALAVPWLMPGIVLIAQLCAIGAVLVGVENARTHRGQWSSYSEFKANVTAFVVGVFVVLTLDIVAVRVS